VTQLLQIANLCEALHVLPEPGGLFDQHPYYVLGILAVLTARVERQELEAKKNKKK